MVVTSADGRTDASSVACCSNVLDERSTDWTLHWRAVLCCPSVIFASTEIFRWWLVGLSEGPATGTSIDWPFKQSVSEISRLCWLCYRNYHWRADLGHPSVVAGSIKTAGALAAVQCSHDCGQKWAPPPPLPATAAPSFDSPNSSLFLPLLSLPPPLDP